jgi:hypothetical protein
MDRRTEPKLVALTIQKTAHIKIIERKKCPLPAMYATPTDAQSRRSARQAVHTD